MNRNDGADRFAPRPEEVLLELCGIERVGSGIDIDEDRRRAEEKDCLHRPEEGERGGDDFIPPAGAAGPEGEMERVCPGADPDAMTGAVRLRKCLLKGSHSAPENELGAVDDVLDGGIDLRFECEVLGVKICEGNLQRRACEHSTRSIMTFCGGGEIRTLGRASPTLKVPLAESHYRPGRMLTGSTLK